MKTVIYISILFILNASNLDVSAQDEYLARSWSNGQPMVVYFLDSDTQEILKEQVFFENGQLDYEGHYAGGVEHGFWTYYWENGEMKSQEFYKNGLEEGTMYDFDKSGAKTVKYVYEYGVLISKSNL